MAYDRWDKWCKCDRIMKNGRQKSLKWRNMEYLMLNKKKRYSKCGKHIVSNLPTWDPDITDSMSLSAWPPKDDIVCDADSLSYTFPVVIVDTLWSSPSVYNTLLFLLTATIFFEFSGRDGWNDIPSLSAFNRMLSLRSTSLRILLASFRSLSCTGPSLDLMCVRTFISNKKMSATYIYAYLPLASVNEKWRMKKKENGNNRSKKQRN